MDLQTCPSEISVCVNGGMSVLVGKCADTGREETGGSIDLHIAMTSTHKINKMIFLDF